MPGSTHLLTSSRPKQKPSIIAQYFRTPGQIGAIAPSSRRLAGRMLQDVDLAAARTVVEYGPGTGAFTREIVRRLGPSTRFLAIELSPVFARAIRQKYPHGRVQVQERSVAEVAAALRDEGLPEKGSVDVIVSGLPWAAFPLDKQREILDATLSVLRPGGVLVTFAYQIGTMLPAGRRFAKLLPEYFARVSRSELVWMNLPPAFVLRCVKAG
ncbi:methyltransferase domain-containing protein [soil metagenome]